MKDTPNSFLDCAVAPLDFGDVCLSGGADHLNSHVVGNGIEWRFAFSVTMDGLDHKIGAIANAQHVVNRTPVRFVGLGRQRLQGSMAQCPCDRGKKWNAVDLDRVDRHVEFSMWLEDLWRDLHNVSDCWSWLNTR